MPVFGTSAATFNDTGVTALYQHLAGLLEEQGPAARAGRAARGQRQDVHRRRLGHPAGQERLPGGDRRVRSRLPRQDPGPGRGGAAGAAAGRGPGELSGESEREVASLHAQAAALVSEDSKALLERWPAVVDAYSGDEQVVRVRDKELRTRLTRESLSGNVIPRVALPRFTDHGELLRFLREENLPGYFPFTAGVFPFKREGEDPARMFAGRGRPVPHQPAVQAAVGGQRGDPAVHRVRLGHPVRPRPGREPGRVRQGRHVGRLDRDPGRHEGAVRRVRPGRRRRPRCR